MALLPLFGNPACIENIGDGGIAFVASVFIHDVFIVTGQRCRNRERRSEVYRIGDSGFPDNRILTDTGEAFDDVE